VIFDPPHRIKLKAESDFIKKYGSLERESWQEDIGNGFAECFRVLKVNSTLIFKWSEVSIPLREVLKLTPYKPVLGHPSGKRMGTHWVLFIKGGTDV
jgi:hypothetical protein